MTSEQLELLFPLMVIAMLVWDPQEAAKLKTIMDELFLTGTHEAADNPNQMPVTPQQSEWAEKAVKKYTEAQEKKWRNWNEAMFDLKQ